MRRIGLVVLTCGAVIIVHMARVTAGIVGQNAMIEGRRDKTISVVTKTTVCIGIDVTVGFAGG